MSLITRMRKQKCVLWAKTGDDEYGKPVYADPVELQCRWDDTQQEFINAAGTKTMSKSIAYPSQAIVVGSLLREGTLDSVPEAATPREIAGAHEVQKADKIPNIRATEFLHIAYM